MNAEDLFLWLRGYVEIIGDTPTPAQWSIIRNEVRQASMCDERLFTVDCEERRKRLLTRLHGKSR